MFQSLFVSRYLLLLMVFSAAPGLSQEISPEQTPAKKIDFQTQIWPILQAKCLECHHSGVDDVTLNLESKAQALKGGHTGNSIFGKGASDSELYLRLISSDPLYRMPKDGDPLGANEIALFQKWIDAGADWPETQSTDLKEQPPASDGTTETPADPSDLLENKSSPFTLTQLRETYDRDGQYLKFLGFPLVLFFLLVLLNERYKKKRRQQQQSSGERASPPGRLPSIGYGHYTMTLLGFMVLAVALFHFGSAENAAKTIRKLEADLQRERTKLAATRYVPDETNPRPPRSRHPRRLGGTYYRGNDERSPKLYNGGFYQTAVLDLWLSDESGERLQWGSTPKPGQLFITLEISRSPLATSSLFTPRVMNSIFLTTQPPVPALTSVGSSHNTAPGPARIVASPVTLTQVEAGERWIAHFPISAAPHSNEDKLSGIVYLYKGEWDGTSVNGKIHYSIEYEIVIQQGQIARESQISMGSLYQFGPRLLIPTDEQIPYSEWFDFRPLPIIEGSNSTDATLLGLPEHESAQEPKDH